MGSGTVGVGESGARTSASLSAMIWRAAARERTMPVHTAGRVKRRRFHTARRCAREDDACAAAHKERVARLVQRPPKVVRRARVVPVRRCLSVNLGRLSSSRALSGPLGPSRPSRAISGDLGAISGDLGRSRAISGPSRGHLGAISGHLGPSRAISGHLWSSRAISSHLESSRVISSHLGPSRAISSHLESSRLAPAEQLQERLPEDVGVIVHVHVPVHSQRCEETPFTPAPWSPVFGERTTRSPAAPPSARARRTRRWPSS